MLWLKACYRRVRNWFTYHSFGLTLGALVVAFFVVYFAPRIFISVYPGQAGVRWKRFYGTLTDPKDIYSEGFYVIPPIDILYIYDLRYQILNRRVSVLTRDGMEISADMGLLYRVRKEFVGELHQQVGENYVESLVIPTLDAAARNILGAIDAQAVYVAKMTALGESDLFEKSLFDEAKEEIGGKYIEVQDVSIMRIALPQRVQDAIQRKHEEEQMALMYNFRLDREKKEAERKRVEAQGIKDFHDIMAGGLTDNYLKFKGIEATLELAKSANSKVVIIGNSAGLPLILGSTTPETPKGGGDIAIGAPLTPPLSMSPDGSVQIAPQTLPAAPGSGAIVNNVPPQAPTP